MDYRSINNTELLKQAKEQTLSSIHHSATSLQHRVQHTVFPSDTTLMQSPVAFVRYAAYGITAFKSCNALVQLLRIIGSERKGR